MEDVSEGSSDWDDAMKEQTSYPGRTKLLLEFKFHYFANGKFA